MYSGRFKRIWRTTTNIGHFDAGQVRRHGISCTFKWARTKRRDSEANSRGHSSILTSSIWSKLLHQPRRRPNSPSHPQGRVRGQAGAAGPGRRAGERAARAHPRRARGRAHPRPRPASPWPSSRRQGDQLDLRWPRPRGQRRRQGIRPLIAQYRSASFTSLSRIGEGAAPTPLEGGRGDRRTPEERFRPRLWAHQGSDGTSFYGGDFKARAAASYPDTSRSRRGGQRCEEGRRLAGHHGPGEVLFEAEHGSAPMKTDLRSTLQCRLHPPARALRAGGDDPRSATS